MSDRPHDTPPPDGTEARNLLVAAYVDGEATPDERARVESDPSLLALAERFRAGKQIVAGVPSLADDRRQAILAAALAEHRRSDVAAASTVTPSPSPGVPSIATPPPPARRWNTRWLAAAAAVVAVCAAGVLVAGQLGGDDHDDQGATPADRSPETAFSADDTTAGAAESDQSDDALGDSATASEAPSAATAPADATQAGPNQAAPMEENDVGAAGDSGRGAPPDDGGKVVLLERGRDLIDWFEDVESGTVSPAGAGDEVCGHTILGWAAYRQPDQYVVVVRTANDRIVAFDSVTCEESILAQVP